MTKWKCEVCTYENWPASIRCAMCQAANCNKVRAENHNNRSKAVATSSSTDIFKMGATSLSRSTSPQLVTQLTEECKWACKYIVQFHEKKIIRILEYSNYFLSTEFFMPNNIKVESTKVEFSFDLELRNEFKLFTHQHLNF